MFGYFRHTFWQARKPSVRPKRSNRGLQLADGVIGRSMPARPADQRNQHSRGRCSAGPAPPMGLPDVKHGVEQRRRVHCGAGWRMSGPCLASECIRRLPISAAMRQTADTLDSSASLPRRLRHTGFSQVSATWPNRRFNRAGPLAPGATLRAFPGWRDLLCAASLTPEQRAVPA